MASVFTTHSKVVILVVVILASLVLVGAGSHSSSAQTPGDTESITISVAGGAPQTEILVSGPNSNCNMPSVINSSSTAQIFQNVVPDCKITFSPVSAQPDSRYILSSGQISWSYTTSSNTSVTDTEPPVTLYFQFSNTWQIYPRGQPTFDPNMTISFSGLSGGSYTPSICSIDTSLQLDFCTGWSDYGSSVGEPVVLNNAPNNTRWISETGTFVYVSPTSGGNTYQLYFYKQVDAIFSASLSNASGSSGLTAPVLSYSYLGSSVSNSISFNSANLLWIDYGSSWSMTNPLKGGTATSRWMTTSSASGGSITSSNIRVEAVYYHQYLMSIGYSIHGSGNFSGTPTVNYTSLGGITVSRLNKTGISYWMDQGREYSFPPVPGNATNERWAVNPVNFGVVSAPSSLSLVYYDQFSLQLGYNATGGIGYSPPALEYTGYGSANSTTLITTPQTYWLDAYTSWSIPNFLKGSNSSERWYSTQTTNGTSLPQSTVYTSNASSPDSLYLKYYWQFYVTFNYSVVGGGQLSNGSFGYGNYSAPSVRFVQLGMSETSSRGFVGWVDGGTLYSFTNPLFGSSSFERWYSGNASGYVLAPSTYMPKYYHQFDYLVNFTVVGGGAVFAPSLNYSFLSSRVSASLSLRSTPYWLDSNSSWRINSILGGSNSTERWATNDAAYGISSSPAQMQFVYYRQFSLSLSYTLLEPGPAPVLYYATFESPASATLNGSFSQFWPDANTAWYLSNPITSNASGVRWYSHDITAELTLAPFKENVTFVKQYYLGISINDVRGGAIPAESGWYDQGARVGINTTTNAGWKFVSWNGSGSSSYTGSGAGTVIMNSPVNETAMFYPILTVTSSPSGSVYYTSDLVSGSVPAGTTKTIELPPGTNLTLRSVPSNVYDSFRGWSGSVNGSVEQMSLVVNSPQSIKASFGFAYDTVSGFAAIAVAMGIVAVAVFETYRYSVSKKTKP